MMIHGGLEMLKRYVVRAESIVTYEAVVFAENQQDAWNKGKELNSVNFDCLDECDFKVFDVFEESEDA